MNKDIVILIEQLQEIPIQTVPSPWKHIASYIVGGLTEIGYGSNSDYLLVISHQGRGLFNCLTGEKIARDYEDIYEGELYNTTLLIAKGIDILKNETISIAGLHGGGLPITTFDGWSLELIIPNYLDRIVVLQFPGKSIYSGLDNGVKIEENDGTRAYGFSETGKSFVIATNSDITIFSRNNHF